MRRTLGIYIVLSIALTLLSGCVSVNENATVKTTPTSLKYAASIDPMTAKVDMFWSTNTDTHANDYAQIMKTCGLGIFTDKLIVKPVILKHITFKKEITPVEQQLLNSYNNCMYKLYNDSELSKIIKDEFDKWVAIKQA